MNVLANVIFSPYGQSDDVNLLRVHVCVDFDFVDFVCVVFIEVKW